MKVFRSLLLAVAFVASTGSTALAQDFDKGVAAYNDGDYATALQEWRPLAEQGHAKAQTILGVMYANGEGVPQDDKEAVKWYRKAADQGYAKAQTNLGWMYEFGRGVSQDYTEAVKWYRKAAEQGFADAQNNLAVMYENGQGVLQNNTKAHMWFNIAADNGVKNAGKWRDEIAERMTSADISKAQSMAATCMESGYKGCGY